MANLRVAKKKETECLVPFVSPWDSEVHAMIGVKDAVMFAKAKAVEVLGATSASLEEIERETYKDRDVWSITLGVPRDLSQLSTFAQLSADPMQWVA